MTSILRFVLAGVFMLGSAAFAQYAPYGNYATTPLAYGRPMYPGSGPVPVGPNSNYGYGVQAPYGQGSYLPGYQGQVTPYGQPCVQGQPVYQPGYTGPQGPCLQPGYNGNFNYQAPYGQQGYGQPGYAQPGYSGDLGNGQQGYDQQAYPLNDYEGNAYDQENEQLRNQNGLPEQGGRRRQAPQPPTVRGPRGH